ncbi:MAG: hypothetical protein LH702_24855, partial [Phormidesmis sp. CAN_BIN44]|nr:hypothetical protein [Phormidesmis sp. CAN_BIN44]
MGSALRYWRFVRLDAGGNTKREDIAPARVFFQQQFSDLIEQGNIPDATVQRHLIQLLRSDVKEICRLAECCLRCFISAQVELTCIALAMKFGERHGFNYQELLPYVLTDSNPLMPWLQTTGYRALAIAVLQTYDSSQGASLATWTAQLVKHDKDLNQFLLDQGVLLVSDWAILNDTTSAQVQRLLSEIYPRSKDEVQLACHLLNSYHAIYLRDRRVQRQAKGGRQCATPTLEQQQEIAQQLRNTQSLNFSTETVLARLRALAEILRQHRIQVRVKTFRPQRSLDVQRPDGSPILDLPASAAEHEAEVEQNEFLNQYRQEFMRSLDQAISQITSDRLILLQQKPSKDQQWLKALYLMHCQGLKMGAIAPLLGLRAQDAVSRLLKLKDFRTDILH